MSKDLTILTTGAGAPGAASIFKALRLGAQAEGRGLRLVTCDMDSEAYGFHLADAHHTIPAGSDPAFIDKIIEICQSEKPDLMFCWVDPELLAIAKNRERIEETGVRVVVSEPDAIETCLDKSRIYDFAHGLGLTPEFRFTENRTEFGDAVRALGYPQNPVCFKPVHGHGGRGFRILKSNADRAEMLFREKPDNSVTTLEDIISLFMDTELPKLIVMEYLPGKEYTVDMLLKDGEPIVTIPRERVSVKLGISNIARLERNEEIIKAAEGIARELGLDYNVNIQFKINSQGMPKLIEVQPRLAGTTAASVGAGANLPWLAAKLALGEDIEKPEINWNTTMKRFWEEVYTDGERNWFLDKVNKE